MPIPDIEVFNEFLASLTFRQPESDLEFGRLEAVPRRHLSDLLEHGSSDSVFLWYRRACHLTPTGVIERLREELRHLGHVSTPEMATTLLAVLCLTSPNLGSPVKRLNAILDVIGPASASQFWISPYPPPDGLQAFHLERFTIGPLDRKKLVYRCNKVDCDFFQRYPDQFSNRFAVEGAPISVRVVDWQSIRSKLRIVPGSERASLLIDYYFECLTQSLQDSFRQGFRVAQEVLAAAGAPYTDLDRPQEWMGVAFVCIFQNVGKQNKGYFCPFNMGTTVSYAQVDRRVPAKIEELKETYSFTGLSDAEVHQTLGTYSRFVVKAKAFEQDERWDEALLHYVIALELVFGGQTDSTQNVSSRTAIVASRALDEDYATTVRRMKEVYGYRSKYVHAGVSVSPQDVELVRPVVGEILYCLLRLQAVPDNRKPGFVEGWLRTLDYFVKAVEAGKGVADEELLEAGVALVPKEGRS